MVNSHIDFERAGRSAEDYRVGTAGSASIWSIAQDKRLPVAARSRNRIRKAIAHGNDSDFSVGRASGTRRRNTRIWRRAVIERSACVGESNHHRRREAKSARILKRPFGRLIGG